MSPPSPAFADRFRIAIALSALKHKPAGQSTASYILDLRAAFPLAARHDAGDESPDAGAWRTRALKLESELRELQSQHDCNLGELASLRTLPPESAPPPKKKAKKSSTSKDISGQPPDIDCLRRDFDRLKDRYITTAFPTVPSLFSSLAALQKISIATTQPTPTLLIATATRSLEALSQVFQHRVLCLSGDTSPTLRSELLKIVSPLLLHLLSWTLPPLVAAAWVNSARRSTSSQRKQAADVQVELDAFLGLFTSTILVPLVGSFLPYSRAHASKLFATSSRKKVNGSAKLRTHESDVRVDLLGLLGTILSALDNNSTVTEHVALEAARELGKVFETGGKSKSSPPTIHSTSSPRPTSNPDPPSSTTSNPSEHDTAQDPPRIRNPADRVEALAQKDAAWYLCGVLNLCCSTRPKTRSGEAGTGGLLQEAIMSEVSRLISWMHPENERGWEVCREMLLAACERAWMRCAEHDGRELEGR